MGKIQKKKKKSMERPYSQMVSWFKVWAHPYPPPYSAKGQLEGAIASRATQRSNREKDALRARLQDFIVISSSRDRTG